MRLVRRARDRVADRLGAKLFSAALQPGERFIYEHLESRRGGMHWGITDRALYVKPQAGQGDMQGWRIALEEISGVATTPDEGAQSFTLSVTFIKGEEESEIRGFFRRRSQVDLPEHLDDVLS